MPEPIRIRFGGYSPPETSHSRAAALLREEVARRAGGGVRVEVFWNVLDFGYRAEDLLSMVECGLLTMCYFSTSYLAGRVPELEILDLPFLFRDTAHAHAALDGALGGLLTRSTESRTGYRVLGYWDNGFRHLSNRLRPVRRPGDVRGMRVRLQPNEVHVRTFDLLGAVPVPVDLKPGIAMIASGEVDAQENPLANTVTYGVNRHHRHVTMSGHFYGARGLYVHKASFDAWPEEVRAAVRESAREAVRYQRGAGEETEEQCRRDMEREGVAFVDLTQEERAAFARAVSPILDEARSRLGEKLFSLAASP